jgi:hypothetical protein
MYLRLTSVFIGFCCAISHSTAAPRVQPFHHEKPLLVEIQGAPVKVTKWHNPKDVYSEFTRLGPKDCERYNISRYPDCADLDTGGTKIKTRTYFEDEDHESGVPITRRSYPSEQSKPDVITVRPRPERPESRAFDPSDLETNHLRRMVGQLLLHTMEGQGAPEAGLVSILRKLRSGEAAGVMIRTENVASASQLKTLSDLLTGEDAQPPLILIERPGASSRTSWPKPGFSLFPAPRELGDKGDALEAFNVYQRMAKELGASGISMNIGPSINICRQDTPVGEELCFGNEPSHAAAFASAFNFAHHDQHVLTAMRVDAAGVSDADHDMFELLLVRMAPDALFVDLGEGDIPDALVQAQLAFRRAGFTGAIIHTRPGTLSPGDTGDALIKTLNSGADMLLFTPSDDWSIAPVIEVMQLAAQSDRLSRSRVRDAFETVYRMNWLQKQWHSNGRLDSDATSSIYRRPVH